MKSWPEVTGSWQARSRTSFEILPEANVDAVEKALLPHGYRFLTVTDTGLMPRRTLSPTPIIGIGSSPQGPISLDAPIIVFERRRVETANAR